MRRRLRPRLAVVANATATSNAMTAQDGAPHRATDPMKTLAEPLRLRSKFVEAVNTTDLRVRVQLLTDVDMASIPLPVVSSSEAVLLCDRPAAHADSSTDALALMGNYHLWNIRATHPVPGTALAEDTVRRRRLLSPDFDSAYNTITAATTSRPPEFDIDVRPPVLASTSDALILRIGAVLDTRAAAVAERIRAGASVPVVLSHRVAVRGDTSAARSLSARSARSVVGIEDHPQFALLRSRDVPALTGLASSGGGSGGSGGLDVTAVQGNAGGFTGLMLAASGGLLTAVLLFLAANADPDAANARGETALHVCWDSWRSTNPILSDARSARRGVTRAIVTALLRAGANPSAATGMGTTPLHIAAGYDHDDVAVVLLRYGAVHNALDMRGRSPLDAASTSGEHSRVASLLRAWPCVAPAIAAFDYTTEWRRALKLRAEANASTRAAKAWQPAPVSGLATMTHYLTRDTGARGIAAAAAAAAVPRAVATALQDTATEAMFGPGAAVDGVALVRELRVRAKVDDSARALRLRLALAAQEEGAAPGPPFFTMSEYDARFDVLRVAAPDGSERSSQAEDALDVWRSRPSSRAGSAQRACAVATASSAVACARYGGEPLENRSLQLFGDGNATTGTVRGASVSASADRHDLDSSGYAGHHRANVLHNVLYRPTRGQSSLALESTEGSAAACLDGGLTISPPAIAAPIAAAIVAAETAAARRHVRNAYDAKVTCRRAVVAAREADAADCAAIAASTIVKRSASSSTSSTLNLNLLHAAAASRLETLAIELSGVVAPAESRGTGPRNAHRTALISALKTASDNSSPAINDIAARRRAVASMLLADAPANASMYAVTVHGTHCDRRPAALSVALRPARVKVASSENVAQRLAASRIEGVARDDATCETAPRVAPPPFIVPVDVLPFASQRSIAAQRRSVLPLEAAVNAHDGNMTVDAPPRRPCSAGSSAIGDGAMETRLQRPHSSGREVTAAKDAGVRRLLVQSRDASLAAATADEETRRWASFGGAAAPTHALQGSRDRRGERGASAAPSAPASPVPLSVAKQAAIALLSRIGMPIVLREDRRTSRVRLASARGARRVPEGCVADAQRSHSTASAWPLHVSGPLNAPDTADGGLLGLAVVDTLDRIASDETRVSHYATIAATTRRTRVGRALNAAAASLPAVRASVGHPPGAVTPVAVAPLAMMQPAGPVAAAGIAVPTTASEWRAMALVKAQATLGQADAMARAVLNASLPGAELPPRRFGALPSLHELSNSVKSRSIP